MCTCTGVTTIDTADNYGGSELLVGQHLRLNPEAAFRTQVSSNNSNTSSSAVAATKFAIGAAAALKA